MYTQAPGFTDDDRSDELFPVTCDINALTPEQQARTLQIQQSLRAEAIEERKLPDGYAFRYKNGSESFQKISEFVNFKRRTSPYVECKVIVERDSESLWLQFTGRGSVRDISHAEFSY